MANVLAFEPRNMARAGNRPLQGAGEILLFTGVRYERPRPEPEEPVRAETAARRARPRRRT